MDHIQTYISQYLANVNVDDHKTNDISSKLAHLIESHQIKLLDLVKALGDYLTADDDSLRPKATMCLSQTLQQLPKSTLSKHDIQVLIGFYLSKFDDVKSTKESLIGINTLIQMDQFPQSNIKPILSALNDQYQSTQHLASTRFFTFDILNNLFELYNSTILKFQEPFIQTFIHIASGEKDPKNLLKSFELNSKISSNLSITKFKDDLFDVLFCYFPISFKPPKDDPYKITSDQLKTALRTAIASSNEFSQDSYPNLLEKLTSTSPTVKKDTIETINQCVLKYGAENLESHHVELWNALKFEILHGDPDDDEDQLFPPILKIFQNMSSQSHQFVELALSELSPNIKNSTNKSKQSCIILASLSSSTQENFNKIIHPILTLLLNTPTLSIPQQRSLITNISYFTHAHSQLFNPQSPPTQENSLSLFKDELLIQLGKSLMSSSLIEVSLRTLAISELTKLTTLQDFLTPQELSLIVQYFTETVLLDDNEYVYGAGIAGLISVGEQDSGVLLEVTYPLLGSLLPGKGVDVVVINEEVKPRGKIFEVIRAITRDVESVGFVIEKLVGKIDEVKGDGEYEVQIVDTLLIVLRQVENLKIFNTDGYLGLINKLEIFSLEVNDSVLDVLGDFIKLIVIYSTPSKHQVLIDEWINKIDFNQENRLINIFVKIVAGVDKSIEFPKIDEFVDNLINFIEIHPVWLNVYNKLGYLQLLSILINKFVSNVDKYKTFLDGDEEISPIKLEIFTWITKAIILKNDSNSVDFINVLVSHLSDEKFGNLVTKSFEILVIDLSIFEKFKKINNNNVRLLYKQKFFQIVSPILVSNFQKTNSLTTKSNYLTALSYILKHTKREIIIPHLTSFFPLLLQALSLPNPQVRYASINTILTTIDEIPELVASHLSSLIPNLLKMVKSNDKLNKSEVRLVSLNCLEALTHCIELTKLVPYQERILKELSPVLDDKKRKVRKAAVDARQAYFELGRSVD
ncbi:hypothetical protein WICANDRAFT_76966 [Wickerhamomyces anomalus NRRL Y-366-8]|uniref:MMS19 nucleotide excision repair protein n=1 Tax=Wickerhamomyces anomalus (strain ATCC 58044 / CBS 1984 / NCYC 433 / NRRL Y-366-8) TaxID=683960 RepID=A0A1E3PC53_WICAA|nr:uncharacterized protein WICANDRAFT_76966 [Wickerhamomyces anomalus NRRL Y-366-8]ODQ62804.1 hypothetical protein WICANDRAFT_76966 [Wickerhamomyces anomalus NRRL Y-366-8]